MILDELFDGYDLNWFIKQNIKENKLPVDNAQKQMKFWIRAHLTQLKDKNIASVPLISIAKELNNVANEFGFAKVDPGEPELIINLIQGPDDSDKLAFIEKIENGVIYLKQKKDTHPRKLEPELKKAEKKHVDDMAKNQVKKEIKKGKL
jgi:hypothetical protein